MTGTTPPATDLARRLWQARRSGPVVRIDDVPHPKTLAEAYAIQREIAALSNAPVRGFKVGSTSEAAQHLLGTDQPGAGLLLAVDIVFDGGNARVSD